MSSIALREVTPEPELADLLAMYDEKGGVLDYVFLEATLDGERAQLHRAAAVAGMTAIDNRLKQRSVSLATAEYPMEVFFRVKWDAAKLKGERVPFPAFWGTDDFEPNASMVDGYKTAFFCPPYTFRGSAEESAVLFAAINRYVLGDSRELAEIFSWSTDWSNYFDAGLDWWGAYFWTINPPGSARSVVVGASSTD